MNLLILDNADVIHLDIQGILGIIYFTLFSINSINYLPNH